MNQLQQQPQPVQMNQYTNQAQLHSEPNSSSSMADVQNHRSQNQNSNSAQIHNRSQINKESSLQAQQQNEATPQAQLQGIKQQSVGQKETQRKKRRKKMDADGRDYSCSCGKSYLSYPALYTHVKTKHNGEISITQNLKLPLGPSQTTSQQNLNSSRKQPQVSMKPLQEDDIMSIEKVREFIYKQFIKDKNKQALMEFRNSLKLREEEKMYVSQIMKQDGYGEVVKVEEGGQNTVSRHYTSIKPQLNGISHTNEHMIPSNSQSNLHSISSHFHSNTPSSSRQDLHLTQPFSLISPQQKKFQRIHVIRTVMLQKNITQNRPNKLSEKKGFISCIFPTEMTKKQSNVSRSDGSSVDEVLGCFLAEFFKTVANNELISMTVAYFVCKVKEYFDKSVKGINTNERNAQALIQESNSLAGYLIEIDNQYIKHPIVVCKMLFFFYRWMHKQQYTQKFVKFNQAG